MRTLKLKKCPRVHALRFTADGRRVLVMGGDEAMKPDVALWLDPVAGETARWPLPCWLWSLDHALAHLAVLIAYDPDRPGEMCRVAKLAVDKVPTFKPFTALHQVLVQYPGIVTDGFALAPGGKQFAVRLYGRWGGGEEDEIETRVHLWQTKPAKRLCEIEIGAGFHPLAFNPDGSRLIVASGEEELVVEGNEIPSGKRVFRHTTARAQVFAIAFADDGRFALAAGRKILVYPPGGPEPALTLTGHKEQVNAVAFSPDGARLMSASHDGAIRVWDAHSGEEVTAFDWKIGPVTAVAIAPDGLTAIAAGKGGQIVVWDVEA